jgi:hypothetical protein
MDIWDSYVDDLGKKIVSILANSSTLIFSCTQPYSLLTFTSERG